MTPLPTRLGGKRRHTHANLLIEKPAATLPLQEHRKTKGHPLGWPFVIEFDGARGRTRTDTIIHRRILNPETAVS
jgi:hypothetical protein